MNTKYSEKNISNIINLKFLILSLTKKEIPMKNTIIYLNPSQKNIN